jgi:predicted amidohydrolase
MEWETGAGLHNVAFVISREGEIEGYQTKNQIPLQEAPYYVPDGKRRIFQIDGVPFGITICHEGWRYPEATRWAAVRGAKVVFHPQLTGSDVSGPRLTRWGDPDSPYYEKAMTMRSIENTVYFASVNYAFSYQESATSLIDPEGDLLAHLPYGEEALLVRDLDLTRATGLIAKRYDPAMYPAR